MGIAPPEIVPRDTHYKWRRLQFPICDSPDGFKKARERGCLKLIDPGLITRFKRLQPYEPRETPEAEALWALEETWNGDKHRAITLLTVLGRVDTVYTTRRRILSDTTLYERLPGVLEDGAEVRRVELVTVQTTRMNERDPAMDVNLAYEFDVTFSHASAIGNQRPSGALRFMSSVVRGILDQFRPLFGPSHAAPPSRLRPPEAVPPSKG